MDRDGHERCYKHREEVSGSSSQVATSHSKKLAKRPMPSTLHEEASLEDSPPRGGTLDSPEEFKCLKIMSLVAPTNWEVVNYNKEGPRNIITFGERACYNSAKLRGTDERFWTFY
jgi:hypothetical protein